MRFSRDDGSNLLSGLHVGDRPAVSRHGRVRSLSPASDALALKDSCALRHPNPRYHHLVLIGASTGGTRVLPEILGALPALRAAVLVIQHMPKFINDSFARTLSSRWDGEVRIAEDGDALEDGLLLLAPSEVHCTLLLNRRIRLAPGPKVNFVCPAIDVTMKSLRAPLSAPVTGLLLTGMGRDGAEGLLHLRNLGATTLVQDQASCAVYGMPAQAMLMGAVDRQLTPSEIVEHLVTIDGESHPENLP